MDAPAPERSPSQPSLSVPQRFYPPYPGRAKIVEAQDYRIAVGEEPYLKEYATARLNVEGTAQVHAKSGIEGGKTVEVVWQGEPSRLAGGEEGEHLRKVVLHYRFVAPSGQRGEVQSKEVLTANALGHLAEAPARIPVADDASGKLEYWFEVHTDRDEARGGKPLYDTRGYDDNYSVPVVPKNEAVIHFGADFEAPTAEAQWPEWSQGRVTAGRTVDLAFDPERFRTLLGFGNQEKYGGFTFASGARVSFDGKPSVYLPLTAFDWHGSESQLHAYRVPIQVPADAKTMRVSFTGGGVWNTARDDNFGRDYVFEVAPADD